MGAITACAEDIGKRKGKPSIPGRKLLDPCREEETGEEGETALARAESALHGEQGDGRRRMRQRRRDLGARRGSRTRDHRRAAPHRWGAAGPTACAEAEALHGSRCCWGLFGGRRWGWGEDKAEGRNRGSRRGAADA